MQEPWSGGGTRFYRARGGDVNGSTCGSAPFSRMSLVVLSQLVSELIQAQSEMRDNVLRLAATCSL